MVHNTPARKGAKELKQRASELVRESRALEGIEGAATLGKEKGEEAGDLLGEARELEEMARLEDVRVWEDSIVRQTKKGKKEYGRWLAGWREGGKIRKVYLGSCRRMSQSEALAKAMEMKAEALGIIDDRHSIHIIADLSC